MAHMTKVWLQTCDTTIVECEGEATHEVWNDGDRVGYFCLAHATVCMATFDTGEPAGLLEQSQAAIRLLYTDAVRVYGDTVAADMTVQYNYAIGLALRGGA